jgi:hypothetical protein
VTITGLPTTKTTTTTSTGEVLPAVELSAEQAGTAGIGETAEGQTPEGQPTPEDGKTLGETTPEGETAGAFTKSLLKNPFVIAGVILLLVGGVLFYVGKKNQETK